VSWSTHPAASATSGAHALGSQDHLQHLVRVFKEIPEFVAGRAEHFLRKLGGNLDARHG